MSEKWQRVTPENLPPEGVMVETKIDDEKDERYVALLCRRGRLWWTGTDGNAVYIYYAPTHWREAISGEGEKR